DRIPQERCHIELRLADHRLWIDHDPTVSVAQQVVMMEVAVNEGRVARMHRRVDLLGLTHEVVIARVIQPPPDGIADPPKGVAPREGHERETPPDDALRKGNAPLTRNFGGRRPQAVRHPRGDSPGRSVEPRALVPGHALARGPRSLARASTKRRSESRFSQGRRSSPET